MEPSASASDSAPTTDPAEPSPTSTAAAALAPVKRDDDGDEPMESPRDAAESPQRWNRDEHARFTQALEAYGGERTGDEWHKIAAFVQTRSLEEVRVHGQQYLQHLVQIHQLQQHQQHQAHLQQQQQRLLQLSRMGQASGGDPLTPFQAAAAQSNNQNDPNGPNSSNVKPARPKTSMGKDGISQPSPLSVAAQSVANAMNAHVLVRPSDAQPVVVTRKPTSSTSAPRGKLKTWNFQEDKVLETALATWQRGKPYSWPKIATSLPGKTAKDVRLRYEQLVEDIASIDKGSSVLASTTMSPPTVPPPLPPKIPTPSAGAASSAAAAEESSSSSSASYTYSSGRPPTHSGLSSRISPPPPIQVPPPTTRAKTESPGILPGSARGRFAMTPSFGGGSGMLSPTFLDFLASEDKPPMPAFSGLSDLPSPLLPSRSGAGGIGDGSSLLLSPMGLDLNTPGGARGRRSLVTPRGPATPRIWHDFLADDFKFDPKAGPSPSASRPPTTTTASTTSSNETSATTTTTAPSHDDSGARRPDDVKAE